MKTPSNELSLILGDMEREIMWQMPLDSPARKLVPLLVKALRRAVVGIENTLYEQRHLADGDNCTLAVLKQTLPEVAAILNGDAKP